MRYLENRGSEWHKWDLHVHIPASGLNNQYGHTEEDWDEYVKVLFTTALQHDVVTLGITDYFLIDGYKKLVNEYLKNEDKMCLLFPDANTREHIKQILVLPNIEFRLDIMVNQNRVNYHVIFSDELTIEDIEENFLNRLQIDINQTPDGTARTMALNKRALEYLGKTLKQQQDTFAGSDYEVGCMNAFVKTESILNALKNPIFKEKYIIVTPVDEDLSGISWNGQGHQMRKLIYQQSHAFFTSNPKTHDFALGKTHNTLRDYIDEFKSFKPCFIGSDAHSLECIRQKLGQWNLERMDQSRITWIKADVTFDGLRQTLYEPETRVSIQSTRPEPKADMYVIDSVSFQCPDKTFDSTRKILFSENLNTIIGGKSSGKSLLIYTMAQTINREMVGRVNQMLNLSGYDFNTGFTVRWKDGTEDTLNSNNPTHSITYIPQLYINYLAEKKNKDELNDFVLELLCQNPQFRLFYENFRQVIYSLNQQLADTFNRIKTRNTEFQTFNKEASELGGLPDAIRKSIDTVKKQLQSVTEQSTLTPEEKQQYQYLLNQLEEINRKEQKNKTCLEFLDKLKNLVEASIVALAGQDMDAGNHENGSIDELFAYYMAGIPQEIEKVVNEINTDLSERRLYYRSLIDSLPYVAEKQHIKQLIQEISQAIAPLTKKQEGQKDVERLQRQLNDLNQKLSKSESLCEKIKVSLDQYENARKTFHALLVKRQQEYLKLIDEINSIYSAIDADSEITLKANIYVERKDSTLYEMINKQRYVSPLFLNIYPMDKDTVNHVELPNFFSNIKHLRDGVLTLIDGSTCHVNKGVTLFDIFESFINDNYKLSFNITYKNDELHHMSPGKKGTVLLILFLQISTSDYPILIDQPEDNLDNRTIYQLLCTMIKRKKSERQIIIVTHNANLVVGTDSENVIVANQQGQIDNASKSYRFEYVNGPIEMSFIDTDIKNELYSRGVREHVCDILEGGEEAFETRERKYGFKR